MVNLNILGGYDNVTFPPGWTDQSASATPGEVGTSLESSGGGTLGVATSPAGNGYLAWSLIPEDAYQVFTPSTTVGYLTRVVAATGGSCGHIDFVVHATGTVTVSTIGIYTGPGFAVGPAAFIADAHTAYGAAGLVSLAWGSAFQLQAGATYWVYHEITTSAAPTFAGAVPTGAQTSTIINVNLTATASFANNSMSLAAGGPTVLAANTTLTPQTSWANLNSKIWYGLKA
jgi:hypothetical protein